MPLRSKISGKLEVVLFQELQKPWRPNGARKENSMNHLRNDRGEFITAVGAPGSPARVKAQYPALIARVKQNPDQRAKLEAEAGLNRHERDSIDFILKFEETKP